MLQPSQMSRGELIQTITSLQEQLERLQRSEQDRHRTQRQWRASEQRYRALADSIALGLYRRTGGPDGRLIMANRALAEMLGYDRPEDVVGRPMADFYWDPHQCEDVSDRLAQDRQVVKRELKMRRRNGSVIWVSVTATLSNADETDAVTIDGIMEDISERKRAEAEQALQRRQLMQADKMISLGVLVSGVAHEINNPNQFIVSNLSPLRRCFEDALPILDRYAAVEGDFMLGGRRYSQRRRQIPEMFQNIFQGAERIRAIVDELRDYAREHPQDVFETIHINQVVESALALLTALVRKSTRHFQVDLQADLPAIRGDYRRLEQVVINLIQNACQALPSPEAHVSVRTFSVEEGIAIEVSDTGVGISPEDLGHITDPFFTTKRSQGGTGLGLSISSTIVKSHGGRLTFASQVGQGTTARVTLPVEHDPEIRP